jgi:DNA polymerase III delta prime subunit
MDNNWLQKYIPIKSSDIVGNKKTINELKNSLINNSSAIIIYGPHGVGKSITCSIILKELNYDVKIVTNSLIKNSKIFKENINLIKSTFEKCTNKGIALIIQDSDTITLSSDKNILIDFMKENEASKVKIPLIFISNEQHSKLLSDVKKLCTNIYFNYPTNDELYEYIQNISKIENINIEKDIINNIINFSQYDIRRLLLLLQDLKFTFKNKLITSIEWSLYTSSSLCKDKDIGLFNATHKLLNKYHNINTSMQLYETEKVLLPLMIFENYPKYLKQNNYGDNIKTICNITNSISLGDVIETNIYSDQNWYLQTIHGFYTCIETSYYINNNNNFNINDINLEFSSDLNKTSLKNINKKNINIIQSFLHDKNLLDLLHLNKIIITCILNNNIEYLSMLAKSYKIPWKIVEIIIKIDKTKPKINIPTKIKKLFQY